MTLYYINTVALSQRVLRGNTWLVRTLKRRRGQPTQADSMLNHGAWAQSQYPYMLEWWSWCSWKVVIVNTQEIYLEWVLEKNWRNCGPWWWCWNGQEFGVMGCDQKLLWILLLMDSAPIKVKRFDIFMMGSGARLWKLWLMGACVMLLAAISVAINLMWGMSFVFTFYHTRGAPGIIHNVTLSPIVRRNLTCKFLNCFWFFVN